MCQIRAFAAQSTARLPRMLRAYRAWSQPAYWRIKIKPVQLWNRMTSRIPSCVGICVETVPVVHWDCTKAFESTTSRAIV